MLGLAGSVAIIVVLTVRITSRPLVPPREVVPLDCSAFKLGVARTAIAEHMRRVKLDDVSPFAARRSSDDRAHLTACGASSEVSLCFGLDRRRAEFEIELLTGYQPADQPMHPDRERKLRFVRGELALCGGAK